jgi:hypothetical protein
MGITLENIERYGVMTDSGFKPMFFAVPCGKCVLCREKKASEWSFRALCENQSSITEPLFVTLTYDNAHKPRCGVRKEDIQNFMKRLRRNLDKLNIEHDIRYFACGEYGKKTHRPHYHLILWNFPRDKFHTLTSCLHFVERAWRCFLSSPWLIGSRDLGIIRMVLLLLGKLVSHVAFLARRALSPML